MYFKIVFDVTNSCGLNLKYTTRSSGFQKFARYKVPKAITAEIIPTHWFLKSSRINGMVRAVLDLICYFSIRVLRKPNVTRHAIAITTGAIAAAPFSANGMAVQIAFKGVLVVTEVPLLLAGAA
jgi:hypothetical protein